ncbi:intein N-terminal splicing region [Halobacillus dabanensis]|uniref:Intein N-terminal splicing region n=1 Tax=Halobacillus dabanensis TaxID=240302 RepID=A0A1I3QBL4_HALDA|nr:hypothetical protein [Halobacillus dabanensis]SFJ30711.1 intein N-terminal splicing region [Halobacillus dabanensis]
MKKLLIFLLVFIVGCSVSGQGVRAFEGHVTAVKLGGLEVECSSAVKRNENSAVTEEGYPCLVLVPHDTPVLTEGGEKIQMDEFRQQAKDEELLEIKVTLPESKDINKDPESRKVRASEITVLE